MSISARVRVFPGSVASDIDDRLFGSFVEHLGRGVYGGIYEPGHATADERGFRRDVIELVKELGVTMVRYPGGNFVSGYRWEDGVGPQQERPVRLDLAWHSIETNQVGIHEFAAWAEEAQLDVMMAVNLGTRGIHEALDLLEYSNVSAGTQLSELRAANGAKDPFGFRMWCLGNEMDGPWQLGNLTPEAYGDLAGRVARAMKFADPTLELVACGSSDPRMPSFGTWEKAVLERCFDDVDFISCHAYFEPENGDVDSFLASGVAVDRFIESVAEIADAIAAERGSDKRLAISFDEWNVWYKSRFYADDMITDPQHWPFAPTLLEDQYTVVDAVVVGSLLISLLKHADRVRAAALAQLVNVIAPIMTETGGAAWRQTIFYPFALTARAAKGGSLVPSEIESSMLSTPVYGDVSAVDSVAVLGADGVTTVFLVNRSLTERARVVLVDHHDRSLEVVAIDALFDDDLAARNSATDADRVTPRDLLDQYQDGAVMLPPASWVAVTLGAVTA